MTSGKHIRAGIFLPPHHPNDEDPTLAMRRDFKLVEFLEELGYEEAWIGEHHSGGLQIYGSPELFIAAVAERTQRIRLGTGVISLPYHNPLMVADRVVQLDHQTRGRAMFGFGPGFLVADAKMMGLDAGKGRDRMVESLEIILRLLAGEVVTYESDWITLHEARLHVPPFTRPRPHIAVASARTPSGGKLAGRFGLGMLCVAAGDMQGYDVLDVNWNTATEVAAEHGMQMDRNDLRVVSSFHLAETRGEALENVKWGFPHWFKYLATLSPDMVPENALAGDSLEKIAAGRGGVIGTPDDAVEYLERLWQKTGGFGCILQVATNWMKFEQTQRSYELFMRYVLPKFDQRNASRDASLGWMWDNRHDFMAENRGAQRKTVEKHFAEQAAKKKPSAAE
jgi:limonene 1,2-monooxygenase